MRRDYLEIARSRVGSKLQDNGSDPVFRYRECQQVLGQTIGEIMLDLQGKTFRDTAEEIGFYKEDAPHIWGMYMFYKTLVKIEAARKFQSAARFRAGLESSLQRVEAFLERHFRICVYYYEGRIHKDKRLFTRRGTHNGKNAIIDIRIDRDFTLGAWCFSLTRKKELLREWLTRELKAPSVDRPQKKLKLYASHTETVELLKAMHLKGDFGDVPFQYVMDWATEVWGVETKNHDQTLQNMKSRKTDSTPYFNKLSKEIDEFLELKKPPKDRR